jgi:hypothetical protein
MRSKRDPDDVRDSARRMTEPSFYERAIRTSIGRGLRSYYDLSEPIPDRMLKLLEQIDDKPGDEPREDVKADGAADPDGG